MLRAHWTSWLLLETPLGPDLILLMLLGHLRHLLLQSSDLWPLAGEPERSPKGIGLGLVAAAALFEQAAAEPPAAHAWRPALAAACRPG